MALDDATPLVRASGRRDAGSRISLSSSEIEPVRFPSEEISVEILREEESCFYPLLAS